MMFEKIKFWLVAVIAILILIYILPVQNIFNYVKFEFYPKSSLHIKLSLVNPNIKLLSSDPSNRLIMKVEVFNADGQPVPNAHVNLTVSENLGRISPSNLRTDKDGESIVSYIPPDYEKNGHSPAKRKVRLTARIYKSKVSSSIDVTLVSNPIVYIPGYQENTSAFDNMNDYLNSKGYTGNILAYDSSKGVIDGAKNLKNYLEQLTKKYYSEGFQTSKFIIISHSMGGLIARYYTASQQYITENNVAKMIFISVPHSGSPWASLGMKYFNDQSIKDLRPESDLLMKDLPGMLNRGLNGTIEVGNILGQYDEVVSQESANLDDWSIKTELFSVGDNNLTMNNLFNGTLLNAANHQAILSNKKVFNRIYQMISTRLPSPAFK